MHVESAALHGGTSVQRRRAAAQARDDRRGRSLGRSSWRRLCARNLLARDPSCELFGIARRTNARGGRARAVQNRGHRRPRLGGTHFDHSAHRSARCARCARILRRDPPDLVVLIDYAEFNLMLAGAARRAGVPVLYYILPQVWAWRRGRIGKLVKRAQRMAVVFPFEAELYARAGGRVSFVGHPLLDRVAPAQDRAATLARHGLSPSARLLALLPGSRRAEVEYLLRADARGRDGARSETRLDPRDRARTDARSPLSCARLRAPPRSKACVLFRTIPIVSLRRANSRWWLRVPQRWRPRCWAARW